MPLDQSIELETVVCTTGVEPAPFYLAKMNMLPITTRPHHEQNLGSYLRLKLFDCDAMWISWVWGKVKRPDGQSSLFTCQINGDRIMSENSVTRSNEKLGNKGTC
jgi:hypothetical protein